MADTVVNWLEPDEGALSACIAELEPCFDAVLDTNVLIDISSPHDWIVEFSKAERLDAVPTSDEALRIFRSPELAYRRERARDGLLLAIHLDLVRARTFCARGEFMRKLIELSPPADNGLIHERGAYTTVWIDLVQDRVLPGWAHQCGGTPESLSNRDTDDALIRFAKVVGVPIITNEKPDGKGASGKIPAKAAALGVRAVTPAEFAGVLPEAAKQTFMCRFEAERQLYLREASPAMHEAVRFTEAILSQLLFG